MHLDFLTRETCCRNMLIWEMSISNLRNLKANWVPVHIQLFSQVWIIHWILYFRIVNLLRDIYRYDLKQQSAKKCTERSIFDLGIEVIAWFYSIKECFFTEFGSTRIKLTFTAKWTLNWQPSRHFEPLSESGRSLKGSDLHCKQPSAQQKLKAFSYLFLT